MPINVQCPTCKKQYALKDEFAGKRAKCAACKNEFTIPRPDTTGAVPPKPAGAVGSSAAGQFVAKPSGSVQPAEVQAETPGPSPNSSPQEPERKGQGRGLMLLGYTILLLALVCGFGGFLWYKSQNRPERGYAKAETTGENGPARTKIEDGEHQPGTKELGTPETPEPEIKQQPNKKDNVTPKTQDDPEIKQEPKQKVVEPKSPNELRNELIATLLAKKTRTVDQKLDVLDYNTVMNTLAPFGYENVFANWPDDNWPKRDTTMGDMELRLFKNKSITGDLSYNSATVNFRDGRMLTGCVFRHKPSHSIESLKNLVGQPLKEEKFTNVGTILTYGHLRVVADKNDIISGLVFTREYLLVTVDESKPNALLVPDALVDISIGQWKPAEQILHILHSSENGRRWSMYYTTYATEATITNKSQEGKRLVLYLNDQTVKSITKFSESKRWDYWFDYTGQQSGDVTQPRREHIITLSPGEKRTVKINLGPSGEYNAKNDPTMQIRDQIRAACQDCKIIAIRMD